MYQGEAECGGIELAVVGLPPPEQGSLFFDNFSFFFFCKIIFLFSLFSQTDPTLSNSYCV